MNVSVSTDEALRRMFSRFIAKKRIVPPSRITELGDKTNVTYALLKNDGVVDGYADVDNEGGFDDPKRIIEDSAGIFENIDLLTEKVVVGDELRGDGGSGNDVSGGGVSETQSSDKVATATKLDVYKAAGKDADLMNIIAEEMFGSPVVAELSPEQLGQLRDRLLAETTETQEATDELPGTVPLSDAGSSAEDGAISDRTSATNAPDRHHRG